MTEVADPAVEVPPKKKSKLPLILGFVLAIAGAGGGFLSVQMGMIGGSAHEEAGTESTEDSAVAPMEQMAFVPLDPLVISLSPGGAARHLKFSAQLEVVPDHVAEVEQVRPRIIDVLNSYLRAVEVADLEDPAALIRLRAQMLRRIQVVVGEGRVRDLLIMEFVLN